MKKVLVVEDDAMLRTAVMNMVRFIGLEPVEATDGAHGEELFLADENILYVLSDVDMPRKTGLEFHVAIAQTLASRGGKFVACSGDHECGERHYFEGVGVTFLRKPFGSSDLQKIFVQ